MLTKDIILSYLIRVQEDLKSDADAKNQKIPVGSFRVEVDNFGGKLYAADYFQYLIYGRGPGKQPPPDAMLNFVQSNPSILSSARQRFKYITERGLAYIIGRKIGRDGTDIYLGKKPGLAFLEILERNTPTLLKQLAENEVLQIQTGLKQTLK